MKTGIARPAAVIVVLFVLTRLWPLCTAEPWSYWEVFEAKKLNYYGWVERRGALLDFHYLAGVVPNPSRFNYPNHPAPIHWVNMLLAHGLGDWGVVVFWTLAGLATCLICLSALRKMYQPDLALTGAALFTLAPSSIIYDVDPNQGAIGAMLWPIAAFGFTSNISTRAKAWFVGIACLLAGQASWMSWTVFGALLVAAFGLRWDRRLSLDPNRMIVAAVFLGGSLTVLLFVVQIALYTSDWHKLATYMSKQSFEQTPLLIWLTRSFSRSAMSLGPALAIGAALGCLHVIRSKTSNPLELTAMIYLPVFAAASFVLRGFFDTENWPYEYLVFPAAILTCSCLSSISSERSRRNSTTALWILSVPGLVYVFLRFSNPILSPETDFIADLMAKEAHPGEVVATNLKDQEPPLPFWNVSGLQVARQKADRLVRSGICTEQQLLRLVEDFDTDQLDVMFVGSALQPMDEQLKVLIQGHAPVEHAMQSETRNVPLSLRLRSMYWKLSGRNQVENPTSKGARDNRLTVVHLRLSRVAAQTGGVEILRDCTGAPETR